MIDRKALLEGKGRYLISLCKEGIDVEEILRAKTVIPADVTDTNDGNIIAVNYSPAKYQIVKQTDLTQDSIDLIADAVVRKLTAEEG